MAIHKFTTAADYDKTNPEGTRRARMRIRHYLNRKQYEVSVYQIWRGDSWELYSSKEYKTLMGAHRFMARFLEGKDIKMDRAHRV